LATEGVFCAIMRRAERGLPELLMAVRADGKGLNLIGGRVEAGETRTQALVREAREETGLVVKVIHQIGEDLPMWKEDQIIDVASIYLVECIGGELKCTEESIGFQWVPKNDLPITNIVQRPCPGFPRGRTYAMAEMALSKKEPFLRDFTVIKQSANSIGVPHIHQRLTEVGHVCWGSLQCTEQTCMGGDNAQLTKCLVCGQVLEDWDYVPGKGAVRRLR